MGHWEANGRSDEWYTPKAIFDALDCTFDLDPANAAADGAHVPCATRYDRNGLELPWFGFVWLNPPFGGRNGIVPWLDRFIEHGNGIALTPDRTSAPWFQDAARSVDAILFVTPKVKFERPDGSIGSSPSNGTALLGIGRKAGCALRRASQSIGFLAVPTLTTEPTNVEG